MSLGPACIFLRGAKTIVSLYHFYLFIYFQQIFLSRKPFPLTIATASCVKYYVKVSLVLLYSTNKLTVCVLQERPLADEEIDGKSCILLSSSETKYRLDCI